MLDNMCVVCGKEILIQIFKHDPKQMCSVNCEKEAEKNK